MYDDFAVIDPEKFGVVANEYQKQNQRKTLSLKLNKDNDILIRVNEKFETLQGITSKLLKHSRNQDVILVLNQIGEEIDLQKSSINKLIEQGITIQSKSMPDISIFCNNLKLAIQLCAEILKELIEVKDNDNTSGEAKLELTNIINAVIDINNKYVSLFGECRYRIFSLKR